MRRRRRPNPPGWTTRTGRGSQHQTARTDALTLMRDGIDCCPYCRRPMYRRQKLDLDDWPPLVIAQRFGIKPHKRLAHAKCNRSAGARLKNWLASQHPELLRTRMTTARPARQPRRQQRRAW